MPAKRKVTTPPPKRSSKHKPAQTSIDNFFTSPSKSRNNGPKRETSVISIVDSDDEIVLTGGDDEKVARELQERFDTEREQDFKDKGKAKEIEPKLEVDEGDDGIELVKEEVHVKKEGINGSSSSKVHPMFGTNTTRDPARLKRDVHLSRQEPSREDAGAIELEEADNGTDSVKKEIQVKVEGDNGLRSSEVHPMFGPTTTPKTPTKPKPGIGDKNQQSPQIKLENGNGNRSPAKITTTSAEAVEPIDFDVDQFIFRPADIDVSRWPKGRLPYSVLVGVYVQVSSTRSRLLIVRVLTNFLHLLLHASPIDLTPTLYLLSNHLLPSYLPCELGIGSQVLGKAVQEVSGLQPRDLKKLWEKWGDPGDVAYEAKSNLRTLVKPSPLLVGDVYSRMLGLSRIKGNQSGRLKGDVVRKLMVQARGEEVRFLVRSLVGNLRIGAVRLTLLTSLARATALFHMPSDLIQSVRPIPAPPVKEKGKRIIKPKVEPDPARDEVEVRCLDAVRRVRKVYVRHPNYGDLASGLDMFGMEGLEDRVQVSVGIPLSPMLGSITRSLNEVFTRLGNLPFTAEAKLDGQRVQIHARTTGPQGEDDGGGRWVQSDDSKVWVRLFSRHLEDMTEKYPDVCRLVLALLTRPMPTRTNFPSTASTPSPSLVDMLNADSITSFTMDAEIVAVDKDTGAYRTFQDLSNRAKKDVRVEDIKVIVGVYAFDLMSLNDSPLLDSPFSHRRHLLRTLFPPFSNPSDPTLARFDHVESLDSTACTDPQAEIQVFFETVVEQKCEGLMVKLLESGEGITGEDDVDDEVQDTPKKKKGGNGGKKKPLPATYEPDQRSQGWLKVKKDYLEGLGDSLDLVPIGAWWGQGRKAGWWSPILLACHNPETGALEAVCKCISGFTDQFYKDLLVRYPPEGEPEKCSKSTTLGYYETNGLRPNVWFAPSEVWEIRGADITLSPVYPAAASMLGSERGLSIRFPRFMKIRDDKSWDQATTSDQFADMYRKQIQEAPARNGGDFKPALQIKQLSEERDVEEEDEAEAEAEAEAEESVLSDDPGEE